MIHEARKSTGVLFVYVVEYQLMMFALGVITGLLFSTIAVLFSIYLAMQNTSPVKQVEKRFGRKAIILEPDLLPKDQEGKDIPIEDLL